MAGPFTLGIEEEYFLVDAETKSLVRGMPQAFLAAAKAAANERISTEFLQPQIEVISSPHETMAGALAELRELQQQYIDQSRLIDLEAYRRRPRCQQVVEDFARLLAPLL